MTARSPSGAVARLAGALMLVLAVAAVGSQAARGQTPGSNAALARAARGAPAGAHAASAAGATRATATSVTDPNAPVAPRVLDRPPPGRRFSANQIMAIADQVAKTRDERRRYPGSYGAAYLKGPGRWQVSYFSKKGKEIAQVIVDDPSGRVLEAWTGFQVPWTMARGYPGAFGRKSNALYIWLPLSVLFVVAFFDWRRPFRMLHLDLLVLISFSVSVAFFNHGRIYASVPLAYPPMLYLLGRMLWIALRRRERGPREPLRLLVPSAWLALALVFLIGFRVGLNLTDSNVIDVGYSGVIGAQRIAAGERVYGGFPKDNQQGDTYGPAAYEAYVPFEQLFGWSGHWDDLPAAHAAAIFFDLLCIGLLFLVGRRVRGPTLGIALAYAWAAYPITLFTLSSNTNDSLVAVFLLAALLVTSSAARGVFAALAAWTKLAPLALAPLFASQGLRSAPREPGSDGASGARSVRSRVFSLALFGAAFAVTTVVVFLPAMRHTSLSTFYDRTVSYQAGRGSPFSVWGLYGGLDWAQSAVQFGAVALALALALVPRRMDVVGLAAAAAAVLIALQLGITHWFYLYIVWFFPLVAVALLARFGEPPRARPADVSRLGDVARPHVAPVASA